MIRQQKSAPASKAGADFLYLTPLGGGYCYLKSSIAYMLYGWIVEWMKREMPESGTELAKMFEEAQGTGINQ